MADGYSGIVQNPWDLRVYKKAHLNALRARKVTDAFPSGYANIKNQLTSAAESIPFNIAEGCGAFSHREFARFLGISIKSTREVDSQIALARDYGILVENNGAKFARRNVDIRKMLCGLRKRVLEQGDNARK